MNRHRIAQEVFVPHRIVMVAVALGLVVWAALAMRWDWIPRYFDLAVQGIWRTLWLLALSCLIGFASVDGPSAKTSPFSTRWPTLWRASAVSTTTKEP